MTRGEYLEHAASCERLAAGMADVRFAASLHDLAQSWRDLAAFDDMMAGSPWRQRRAQPPTRPPRPPTRRP